MLFAVSCVKEPVSDTIPVSGQGSWPVKFLLEVEPSEEMNSGTRAADENVVRDINLWTCGTDVGCNVHLYVPGGKTAAALTLIPDNYHFYAVANAGRDLGEMTETAL